MNNDNSQFITHRNFIFNPKFVRSFYDQCESRSYIELNYENYPARVLVFDSSESCKDFLNMLKSLKNFR